MRIYYIETDMGCGLRSARNINQARAEGIRETGTVYFKFVRRATETDLNHVRCMGGYVPEGKVDKDPDE